MPVHALGSKRVTVRGSGEVWSKYRVRVNAFGTPGATPT